MQTETYEEMASRLIEDGSVFFTMSWDPRDTNDVGMDSLLTWEEAGERLHTRLVFEAENYTGDSLEDYLHDLLMKHAENLGQIANQYDNYNDDGKTLLVSEDWCFEDVQDEFMAELHEYLCDYVDVD